MTVSDPVVTDSGDITIDIINQNEAPAFSQASYSISADEGSVSVFRNVFVVVFSLVFVYIKVFQSYFEYWYDKKYCSNLLQAGTSLGIPAFGVTDPDIGDTSTLTLDCGAQTGNFLIDTSSGEISYQSDYDLDAGVLPTSVTCTVTVTDSGGLTDTADLYITISR